MAKRKTHVARKVSTVLKLLRGARKTGKPRVIKYIPRQTGSVKSLSRDRLRSALPPGKRISSSGRIYWETRKNRSDRRGRRV